MYRRNVLCFSLYCSTICSHCDIKFSISITCSCTSTRNFGARTFAKVVYEEALRDGFVNIYRGRIVLVGQDRSGKTSLKKTLLGLPFDYQDQSTDGIEIEPSKFEIEVERIKSWTPTDAEESDVSEFSEHVPRMLARKRYHCILSNKRENPGEKSEWAQPQNEAEKGSI